MTQRDRIRDEAPRAKVGVYDTRGHTGTAHADDMNLVKAADQVRRGPIIAGLFTALTTPAVLAVLGLAVGLSSYDANDPLRQISRCCVRQHAPMINALGVKIGVTV